MASSSAHGLGLSHEDLMDLLLEQSDDPWLASVRLGTQQFAHVWVLGTNVGGEW
jgi:hypothetical protein